MLPNIISCDVLTPWIKLWFTVVALVVAQAFLFPIPSGHSLSLLVETESSHGLDDWEKGYHIKDHSER